VSSETGKVNINTADATTLASTLKGVGLKKAEAIIEYRKTYGPFHDIQELAEVSGIGNSIVEKNIGMIGVK
jgi:competence protein ComEA